MQDTHTWGLHHPCGVTAECLCRSQNSHSWGLYHPSGVTGECVQDSHSWGLYHPCGVTGECIYAGLTLMGSFPPISCDRCLCSVHTPGVFTTHVGQPGECVYAGVTHLGSFPPMWVNQVSVFMQGSHSWGLFHPSHVTCECLCSTHTPGVFSTHVGQQVSVFVQC